MNKEQQLKMCKEYYKNLCKQIKANQAENFRLSPTGYFARTAEDIESPSKMRILRKWTVTRMLLGAAAIIPVVATFWASLPLAVSFSLVTVVPFMAGMAPLLLGYKFEESPGKMGLKMNKLYLNYTLKRFKKYFEDEFSFLLNAKDARKVDQEDINLFIQKTYDLAKEYDNFAFNVGDKIIETTENKAYNKIENILKKQGVSPKTEAQIQKIVEDTKKTTDTWRNFYSSQKDVIEDLYYSVVKFDPENKEELLCIRQAGCELENYTVAYKESEFNEDVKNLITRYNFMQNGKPMDVDFLEKKETKPTNVSDFTKGFKDDKTRKIDNDKDKTL